MAQVQFRVFILACDVVVVVFVVLGFVVCGDKDGFAYEFHKLDEVFQFGLFPLVHQVA
jgi:hypothetical protein